VSKSFPRQRLQAFAEKVNRRAKMIIESPRTIDGRIVRRVATGKLAESLGYNIKGGEITFLAAKHWYWVEYGRKPSSKYPPMQAMRNWVIAKGIKPRDKHGRFIKITPAAINSIAFLAAKKVKEKGYKGIGFYAKAIERETAKPNNDLRKGAKDYTVDEMKRRLKITIKNANIK